MIMNLRPWKNFSEKKQTLLYKEKLLFPIFEYLRCTVLTFSSIQNNMIFPHHRGVEETYSTSVLVQLYSSKKSRFWLQKTSLTAVVNSSLLNLFPRRHSLSFENVVWRMHHQFETHIAYWIWSQSYHAVERCRGGITFRGTTLLTFSIMESRS